MTRLRSEIMAEAWRARYVRGEIELDEMEAGVDRALRGHATDAEWLALAHEETLRQLRQPGHVLAGMPRPITLEPVQRMMSPGLSDLRRLYVGNGR